MVGLATMEATTELVSASVPDKVRLSTVSSRMVTDCATAMGASLIGARFMVTEARLAPFGDERSRSDAETRNTTGPLAWRAGS